MALEILYTRKHLSPNVLGYELADTRTSLVLGIFNVGINGVTKLASIPLFAVFYEHRLANLGQPDQLWSWLVLLFAEDNCYYWFHRLRRGGRGRGAARGGHH